MDRVFPYESFADAVADLDNGGRFYHLFSRRGDAKITRAELELASAEEDARLTYLFFAMVLTDLSPDRRQRIVSMLEDDLREELERMRPISCKPSQISAKARVGLAYLVEGFGRLCTIAEHIKIPVPTQFGVIPVSGMRQGLVFEVFDSSAYTGTPCLLTLPADVELPVEGLRLRWGGVAREMDILGSAGLVHLAARYYAMSTAD